MCQNKIINWINAKMFFGTDPIDASIDTQNLAVQ